MQAPKWDSLLPRKVVVLLASIRFVLLSQLTPSGGPLISTFLQMEPAGHNYTLILHMKHHNALVTGGDRAYLLQCFIGKPLEDQELTADLGVMKG